MATTSATAAFDAAALKRAVEERDANGQVALFADDAVIEMIDKENPPSRPVVLKGRDAIREYLHDVTSRDMTHSVSELVIEGDHGAYSVDCRYPDGARVLCMATVELRDGRIQRQRGIQAWDE
jgi:ketosteroid isomerase-like protein